MNKYTAVITSMLLMFSSFNSSYAVNAGSSFQSPNKSYTVSFSVPAQLGFISDSFIRPNNDRLIILIQDLHNDKNIQTSIKNIIANIDQNYGFSNIFIEGLYNKPVWLAKENSDQIADILFEQSYLTGAEHYALLSGNLSKVLPLDDKEIYKNNIQRLGYLILLENEINAHLSKLDKSIGSAKNKIYSSKNKKINRLTSKYRNGKISQKTFYSRLRKYISDTDLLNMPNIASYYDFLKIRKINPKKLNKEMSSLLNELKKILPYSEYSQFISKISDGASYGSEIERIVVKYSIDLKKYKEIENYIKADKAVSGLDSFAFVDEEKELIRELKIKHSKTQNERLLIVLDDLYAYYKDFLTNKLTEYGYNYLNNFGIDNFVNLWAGFLKNKDIYNLTSLHKYFDEYNHSNIYRSKIFIQNILQARQSADGNIIAVMGGFHTKEVAEYLKYNGISYAVITPSLSAGINKQQNSLYKQNVLRSIDIKYNAIPPESALNDAEKQADLINDIEENLKITEIKLKNIFNSNFSSYGEIASIKSLSKGNNDRKPYLITTKNGKKYVLKPTQKITKMKAERNADYLSAMSAHLQKNGIPVSAIYGYVDDGDYFYTLIDFFEFKQIDSNEMKNNSSYFYAMGEMLAKLHNVSDLASENLREIGSKNAWDIFADIEWFERNLENFLDKISNSEYKYFIRSQYALFKSNLREINKNNLRKTHIQGDFHNLNIFFNEDNVISGIVDLDQMAYNYRALEFVLPILGNRAPGFYTRANFKALLSSYVKSANVSLNVDEIKMAIEILRYLSIKFMYFNNEFETFAEDFSTEQKINDFIKEISDPMEMFFADADRKTKKYSETGDIILNLRENTGAFSEMHKELSEILKDTAYVIAPEHYHLSISNTKMGEKSPTSALPAYRQKVQNAIDTIPNSFFRILSSVDGNLDGEFEITPNGQVVYVIKNTKITDKFMEALALLPDNAGWFKTPNRFHITLARMYPETPQETIDKIKTVIKKWNDKNTVANERLNGRILYGQFSALGETVPGAYSLEFAGSKQEITLESELKKYTSYATEEVRANLETYLNGHLRNLNKTKFTEDDFTGIDNFYDSKLDDSGVTISLKIDSEIIKFRYDYQSKKLFFVFNSPKFRLSKKHSAVLEKLQASADKAGFEIYVEGGFIRDSLLGIEPGDFDCSVRNKNGEIFSDLEPLYEQLKKDFPDSLEHFKGNKSNRDGKIFSINFFLEGVEFALIQFKGFDIESKKDATVNAFFYNSKTNEIIDVTNRGFSDLLNKKMVIPYADEYLSRVLNNGHIYKLSGIIRHIRISFKTGFELPIEIKNVLDNKKVTKQLLDEYAGLYNDSQYNQKIREANAKTLFSLFETENTEELFRYLHKYDLLASVIPEIKNISRAKITYMFRNISQANSTRNDKFAALLTAFSKEDALKILEEFPKIIHGYIDVPTLNNNDINEIKKRYDEITTNQTGIFRIFLKNILLKFNFSKKTKEIKTNLNLPREVKPELNLTQKTKPDSNFQKIIGMLNTLSIFYQNNMNMGNNIFSDMVKNQALNLIDEINERAKQSTDYLKTLEELVKNANKELLPLQPSFVLDVFKSNNTVKIKVVNKKKRDPTQRSDISDVFTFTGEKFKESSLSEVIKSISNMSSTDFTNKFKTDRSVLNNIRNIITSNDNTRAVNFLEQTNNINLAYYVFAHFYENPDFIADIISNESINIKIRLYAYAKAKILDIDVSDHISENLFKYSVPLIKNEMIVRKDNSNLPELYAFLENDLFRNEIFVSYHAGILLYLQSVFPEKKISKAVFEKIMGAKVVKGYNGSGDESLMYGEEHLFVNNRFANISAHEFGHNFLRDINIAFDGLKEIAQFKSIVHEFYSQTLAHIFVNGNGFGTEEIDNKCRGHFNRLKHQYESKDRHDGTYQYNFNQRSPHLGGYSLLYMLNDLLNLSDNNNAINLARAIENITLKYAYGIQTVNEYIVYDYTIELLKEYGRLSNYDVSKTIEYLENKRPRTQYEDIWLFPKIDEIPAAYKPTPLTPNFANSLAYAKEQSLYPYHPAVEDHKVDKHLDSSAMPNQSLYANILRTG